MKFFFYNIIFIPFCLSLVDCETIGEVPLSSSGPKQGVPVIDPEIEAPSTSFDAAEVRPHAEIPSSVSPIGKSFIDNSSNGVQHGQLVDGAR